MSDAGPDHDLPPHLLPPPPRPEQGKRRRGLWAAVLVAGAVVVGVLAFGVFGVQNLWIDDQVSEAGPVFASGASTTAPLGSTTPATTVGGDAEHGLPGGSTATAPDTTSTTSTPEVRTAATGAFVSRGHPSEGTASLLTDGHQTFVRFEDDFSTSNGPDLRVRIFVGDEVVDLGELKGNIGSQNYEIPATVDPTSVTSVDVWCRRFDYVFTDAALAPA